MINLKTLSSAVISDLYLLRTVRPLERCFWIRNNNDIFVAIKEDIWKQYQFDYELIRHASIKRVPKISSRALKRFSNTFFYQTMKYLMLLLDFWIFMFFMLQSMILFTLPSSLSAASNNTVKCSLFIEINEVMLIVKT